MPSLDDDIKIGAREAKQKMLAEAIRNLKKDRTLLVLPLSAEAPIKAEVIENVKTLEQAFKVYQPRQEMVFEDAEGQEQTEEISFTNLGDFTPGGMGARSVFLGNLQSEMNMMEDFVKKLKSNKALRRALENPETRDALIAALDALMNEIPD